MARGWTLFLDDVRIPKDDSCAGNCKIARSVSEAQKLIFELGVPEYASLDHDLGVNYCRACIFSDVEEPCINGGLYVCGCDCHYLLPDGMSFLKWVAENNLWPKYKPNVHSANPIGATNMRNFIEQYGPYNTGQK